MPALPALNQQSWKGGRVATRSARGAGAISGVPLRRRSLRSGGDIAMLRHARDVALPSLAVLLDHDDAKREHAYDEPDNASRQAATRYGFPTISMKNDWGQVFTFQG